MAVATAAKMHLIPGPTSPLQEPSSSACCEPHMEPERSRKMLGHSKRMDGGTRAARATLQPGQHLVPRSPPQSLPPPHQLGLVTAKPCRDAFCSQAQALHVLLAVPPAANGNALQTLEGGQQQRNELPAVTSAFPVL